MSIRRAWQPAVGLLMGFAAVSFALLGTQTHEAHPRQAGVIRGAPTRTRGQGPSLSRPFLHGVDVSLAGATKIVGFNIPRPNDPLASDDQVKAVWVDTSSGQAQIAIVYSSGVYVEMGAVLSSMANPKSALAAFNEMASEDAAQSGGQAQVVAVDNAPAYLVPENSMMWANGESQGAPGDVERVVDDEVVDVSAHLSNDDLLRVSSTLSARPA